jgi:thiamine biosynthesis lipoprotein
MRQVAHIMGMPITAEIPDCNDEKIFELVFSRFKQIDHTFSPYKQNSELSKYQRGELVDSDLSPEFKKIMQGCKEASKLTNNYFSAYYSGKFDPSGYVKGWAIDEAGRIIKQQGYSTYCIGAGGDILASSDAEKLWTVGIQDPKNKQQMLGKLSILSGAVATSGNYERGAHIINPKTGAEADELLSVSVLGPDIIKADILATATFAEGLSGLIMIEESENYEALAIDQNEDWYMSSGMENIFQLV